jgi:integrase
MSNSTRKRKSRKGSWEVKGFKIKRPYPDFPLTPHASGMWLKNIRGKFHFFGRWARRVNGVLTRIEGDGWEEAVKLYKSQADDLHAGRTPRAKTDELTVGDLCNRFLTMKLHAVQNRELSNGMYEDYKKSTDRLVATLGVKRLVSDLAGEDFASLRNDLAKQYGPVRLSNEVQKVRTVFKFGYEDGLMDRPIRFGQFKKPSRDVLRRHRAAKGKKMLEANEVKKVIDSAGQPVKAMLLLAINCAYGPRDLAELPLTALDLNGGWATFPRVKNGIPRRAKLWDETVIALREAVALRPSPKTDEVAKLVFLTVRGRQWLCRGSGNPISVAMRCLMKEVGVHREGIGAYTLRHVFRTIADRTKDQNAIRMVMGHSDGGAIDSHYIEGIDDSRLEAVANCVHDWLFGTPNPVEKTTPLLKVVG